MGWWLAPLALVLARRRRVVASVAGAAGLVLASPASAHESTIWILTPEDDFCDFIANDIVGGDIVKLSPGVYQGPCDIVGVEPPEAGELTIVESLDPTDRAVIAGDGVAPYVLSIGGVRVWLNTLLLEGAAPDGTLLEIRDGDLLQVRFSIFDTDTAADGIRVVGAPSDVWVTDNEFRVGGSAVVAGCDDGSCAPDGLQIWDNWVAEAEQGIVVHGGIGTLSDNVVQATSAGIVLSGAIEATSNWSTASPAFEVRGAGPVLRTNLVEGDVVADDPGVSLWANSIVGEVTVPDGTDSRSNLIAGALPPTVLAADGNSACDPVEDCWVDMAAADFRPVQAAPEGVAIDEVVEDFCGTELAEPPLAGAFAQADESWVLVRGFKKAQACGLPSLDRPDPDEPTTPTQTTEPDPATPPKLEPEGSCGGCATTGTPTPWVMVLGWLALVNTRRRGPTNSG